MPILDEEFMRCPNCSNATFTKEERVTLEKNNIKRGPGELHLELPITDKEIVYRCTNCNGTLDK